MDAYQVQISPAARQDLRYLLDWGAVEFGEFQAARYREQLRILFESIGRYPEIGVRLTSTSGNCRSIIHESHRVIYEVRENHVRI